MDTRRPSVLFGFTFVLLISRIASAQCPGSWITGEGPDGTNNSVFVLKVLANGDLIAGGAFTTAGVTSANRVALWNGTTWSALGTGVAAAGSPNVQAVTVMPNGDLIVGGRFDTAGGITVNNIARWDGANWSALGTGMTGGFTNSVRTLAVLNNGDLVAGGDFTAAGGTAALFIARWNGSAWFSMGSGFTGGGVTGNPVNALQVLPGGDLIVAGQFNNADGVLVNNVARWNGTSYSSLGGGVTNQLGGLCYVNAIALLSNGDLIVGGSLTHAGGAPASNIARWDGAAWSPLAAGTGLEIAELALLQDNTVIAAGSFTTAGGNPANRIARWNGSTWSTLGTGVNNAVAALAVLLNGDLIVGGAFTSAGGSAVSRVARWRVICPPGDLDSDNDVDDVDQSILVDVLLGSDVDPSHMDRADVNNDGNFDGLDISAFTACRLGACP
jgi:hypothetical protein